MIMFFLSAGTFLFAVYIFLLFCFFKQKTAYELRNSDWSSDVCSSDLANEISSATPTVISRVDASCLFSPLTLNESSKSSGSAISSAVVSQGPKTAKQSPDLRKLRSSVRSEEHTSELQSLMRISYAVFCLKKKKKSHKHIHKKHKQLEQTITT